MIYFLIAAPSLSMSLRLSNNDSEVIAQGLLTSAGVARRNTTEQPVAKHEGAVSRQWLDTSRIPRLLGASGFEPTTIVEIRLHGKTRSKSPPGLTSNTGNYG